MQLDRSWVAERANACVVDATSFDGPLLSGMSEGSEVRAWLVACDGNGDWEGLDTDELWEALDAFLADCEAPCDDCDGVGWRARNGVWESCPHCYGLGVVTE